MLLPLVRNKTAYTEQRIFIRVIVGCNIVGSLMVNSSGIVLNGLLSLAIFLQMEVILTHSTSRRNT